MVLDQALFESGDCWDAAILGTGALISSAQQKIENCGSVVQRQANSVKTAELESAGRGDGRNARVRERQGCTHPTEYFDTPQRFELPESFHQHEIHGTQLFEQAWQRDGMR